MILAHFEGTSYAQRSGHPCSIKCGVVFVNSMSVGQHLGAARGLAGLRLRLSEVEVVCLQRAQVADAILCVR